MSRLARWTTEQLDQAENMRSLGEKWIVVEAIMGEGIKNAVEYRRMRSGKHSICDCNQGRLPCSCKPDAWKIIGSDGAQVMLTEHEANMALHPGVTKHPLFMRDR